MVKFNDLDAADIENGDPTSGDMNTQHHDFAVDEYMSLAASTHGMILVAPGQANKTGRVPTMHSLPTPQSCVMLGGIFSAFRS